MSKPRVSDAELEKMVSPQREMGLSDREISKKLGVSFARVARVERPISTYSQPVENKAVDWNDECVARPVLRALNE